MVKDSFFDKIVHSAVFEVILGKSSCADAQNRKMANKSVDFH